jgi:hypothetical protein
MLIFNGERHMLSFSDQNVTLAFPLNILREYMQWNTEKVKIKCIPSENLSMKQFPFIGYVTPYVENSKAFKNQKKSY